MPEPVIDPETIDLDELRALANEELAAAPVENDPKPVETDTEAAPPVENETEEVVYRREIDLGDGSGVQVFEGDTLEELVDKLAGAQEHATRKIREQALLLKDKSAPKPAQTPEPSQDEEWMLGQQLMTKPTEAFRKMFEREVGVPLDQFKTERARNNALTAAAAEHDASVDFVEAHPEYSASPANGRRMVAYMKTYQLPGTLENMEKAYKDLSESGLLEAKKDAPETPAPTPAPTKARSGISAKGGAAAPALKTSYTEDELYSMDESKLEELARKSSL